ncbi:hypothetical protein CASFOL_023532 [Castilleja foliolosa]|uniref:Uncharacterized protein n=1 Tax=Castilleja foliolosa TaxID=1961234 RepID=A0ABD3CKT5_9LAMI
METTTNSSSELRIVTGGGWCAKSGVAALLPLAVVQLLHLRERRWLLGGYTQRQSGTPLHHCLTLSVPTQQPPPFSEMEQLNNSQRQQRCNSRFRKHHPPPSQSSAPTMN